MKKVFYFMIIFLNIIFAKQILASNKSNVGTTGASLLKFGYGARAIGMGDAFTAITNDINSLYYNPAGIIEMKNSVISFMRINWFEDVNYNVLSYTTKFNENNFGVSIGSFDYGSEDKTDDLGNKIGSWDASDKILHLTYARKIKLFNQIIPFGINLKYIHQKIDEATSQSIVFDFGGMYKFNQELNFGLMIQNLGKMSKFENESDPLPLNIKLGVAYQIFEDKLITSFDINYPNDNSMFINFGVEYLILPIENNFNLKIRAGYNGLDSDRKGYTLGFGLKIYKFDLDYAFLPFDEFENTHRLSINYNFPKILSKPKKKIRKKIIKIVKKEEPIQEKNIVLPPLPGIVNKQKISQPKSQQKQIVVDNSKFFENGKSRLLFFRSKTIKYVAVVGSFNNWDKYIKFQKISGTNDLWYCIIDAKPGKYYYKLIVDGEYTHDKSNPNKTKDQSGSYQSILFLSKD